MSRPSRARKPVEAFVAGPAVRPSRPEGTCFTHLCKSLVKTASADKTDTPAKKRKQAENVTVTPTDDWRGGDLSITMAVGVHALEENTNITRISEPTKRPKRAKTSAMKYFEIIFRRGFTPMPPASHNCPLSSMPRPGVLELSYPLCSNSSPSCSNSNRGS